MEKTVNLYSDLANSITDLFFAMDSKLRYTFWNRASEELTGIKAHEALGRSLFEIFPDNGDTQKAAREYRRVLKTHKARMFTNEYELKGQRLFFELYAYPSGNGVAVWARDITERRLAEEALKKAEKELLSIYNAISGHLTIVDKNYHIVSYNKAIEDHFGNNLVGRLCYEAYKGRNEICPGCAVKKTLETKGPAFSFQPATSVSKPIEIFTYPLFDESGEVTAVIEHGIEATEKIKIAEALRVSEEKFRRLADNAPDIIFTVDRGGIIQYTNNPPDGMTAQEAIGTNSLDYVSPANRETVRKAILRVFDTGAVETFEISARGPYDTTSWYSTHLGPIKSGNDVVAAIMVTRDITASKLTEEALRESEERYRSLFDAIIDAVYVHSVTDDRQVGQLIEVNDAACRMLGYTRKELTDITLADIEAPDSERRFGEVIENLKDGELVSFEQTHIAKDGRRFPVEVHAKLFQYNGELSVFATAHDLTNRKKGEEEREKLQAQLNQARKMETVGQLAGGVAHDFNNMLAPIIGYAGMLLDDMNPDDPKRESVEEINKAALRAKAVTQQLLAFGRKQALEVKTLDLNRVIDNFTKILRRTIREDINIELLLDPSLKSIKADAGQLEQVVMNLAVNAQDAMPNGGIITIKTSNLFFNETFTKQRIAVRSGWYAVLEVSDTGVGMDSRTADRVFEPFFTTKEVGRGTGLGLATVYGIVKQHGGYVWVHSQPGRGTKFEIYLPSVTDFVKSESKTQVIQPDPPGRETVLIAEDEEAVSNMVRRLLERQGYSVLYAGIASDCLHATEGHDGPIHLLLTDIVMPGMNGKEVYKRLSAMHSGLKVLFMSGYTDSVIALHGVLEQGTQFIQKPFTPQALSNKVREVLDARSE